MGTANVDRKTENPNRNTGITDTDGWANNLDIGIGKANRRINNLGIGTSKANRGANILNISISKVDRRTDDLGTKIADTDRLDKSNTNVDKVNNSSTVADKRADRLTDISNNVYASLFFLHKVLCVLISFFELEIVFTASFIFSLSLMILGK